MSVVDCQRPQRSEIREAVIVTGFVLVGDCTDWHVGWSRSFSAPTVNSRRPYVLCHLSIRVHYSSCGLMGTSTLAPSCIEGRVTDNSHPASTVLRYLSLLLVICHGADDSTPERAEWGRQPHLHLHFFAPDVPAMNSRKNRWKTISRSLYRPVVCRGSRRQVALQTRFMRERDISSQVLTLTSHHTHSHI
jgi:hypothetical protein